MNSILKVLMIEDSSSLTEVYKAYLDGTNYDIVSVETLAAAHTALAAYQPDIVLLDIELPDGSGMDFLADAQASDKPTKIIVMTAHGTTDMAVEAIQLGAIDFLTKPFDAARLKVTLNNAASQLRLGKRVSELASLQRDHFGSFIGKSPAMQSVYKTIESLASSDATGFIVGESGTGKELAAEAIHQHSRRHNKEFVAINCGAIPGELMESELFGHVKGAFTGASSSREGAVSVANGGTLFLDEICEMNLELQKKLLRFIQTGTFRKVGSNTLEKVDLRFVCATNRDPLVEVREGRFREDLFYRLHVVPVRMPPLRERGEDVLLIANHFLALFNNREAKSFEGFSVAAEEAIRRYPWPGNVRQLQNAMHQVVVLSEGDSVELSMLPTSVTSGQIDVPATGATGSENAHQHISEGAVPHVQRRQQVEPLWLTEKNAIEAAIEVCGGSVNQAAGLLEVAPSTVYRKLQSWKKRQA
ncbi:sigma-54-dependent Fis family transcriptional regulator [Pseudomaricurvus alkylphenolicus]|jgi:two-component system repressor protein LuxO|uniref:sigma-54-dependent transcriptional regulator n=1 Tax=Pseudomaricurvus alkylphenolicus TaxID=1306991 RepID=UPI0014245917|nr:sigma-54 dependent transcriptional regulator [Pseudomaricurvus alkylphenolicus]NIB39713.1 sigma-54-dependent Fis family transcriptional regulator [Pseudomaricurvus alkylphenolicus]